MNKQELEIRIGKKKEEIAKADKAIVKYASKFNDPTLVDLCNNYLKDGNYDPVIKYRDDNKISVSDDRDMYISKIFTKYDAIQTLKKYETQLNKLTNFENEQKIEVIWNFLQNWRQNANEYMRESIQLYNKLKEKYNEEFEKFKNTDTRYKEADSRNKYYIESDFREKYYSAVPQVALTFRNYNGQVREEELNKWLDAQVRAKYTNLVHIITDKVGEITDASGLYEGADGNINGIVIGKNGKAKVQTIMAGGKHENEIVNVKRGQILHFRILCHKIA